MGGLEAHHEVSLSTETGKPRALNSVFSSSTVMDDGSEDIVKWWVRSRINATGPCAAQSSSSSPVQRWLRS